MGSCRRIFSRETRGQIQVLEGSPPGPMEDGPKVREEEAIAGHGGLDGAGTVEAEEGRVLR